MVISFLGFDNENGIILAAEEASFLVMVTRKQRLGYGLGTGMGMGK